MAFYVIYNESGIGGDSSLDRLCMFETREACKAIEEDPYFRSNWFPILRNDARKRFPKAFRFCASKVIYTDYDRLDQMLEKDDGIDHWVYEDSHTMAFWTGFPRIAS